MSEKGQALQAVSRDRYIQAARKLARVVTHTDPPPEIQAERDELEGSLKRWMLHHGGIEFYAPFSEDHLKMIRRTELALNYGGHFAVAMPRGHGKTTILKWATLYAVLTGRRKFVVTIAANGDLATDIMEFCKIQLSESESLHEHYPHVTTYIRAADGKPLKARYMLRRGDFESCKMSIASGELVLPDVTNEGQRVKGRRVLRKNAVGYPSCGAILECYGILGAFRGRVREGGIRPDFVLIDDPQDRESAESPTQTAKRERIITGDVLGLAGPTKKIAAIMPCTKIQANDLADRFLDPEIHPEWQGLVCKLVYEWPDEQEGLWEDYRAIYRTGLTEGRGTVAAFEFYQANREVMDAGAVVGWEHRIRDGEISAIQTAQNLLLEHGDQFWAEYQNDPRPLYSTIYVLTPELVMSREDPDQVPGMVPEWARLVIAATDINPTYALTSAVVALGLDQRAAVLWYGRQACDIPYTDTDREKRRKIFIELQKKGLTLAGLPCRPTTWIIDGGGSPADTVIDFAAASPRICGLPAWCAFGRGGTNYRATGRKDYELRSGDNMHTVFHTNLRQWIIWNADYWREIAQKGWTGTPGGPGSCSLPRSSREGEHRDFAEQICREQLKDKTTLDGKTVWAWHTASGEHDYGDCMAMAYMGGSLAGITTAGAMVATPTASRTQRPRRRAKVRMET